MSDDKPTEPANIFQIIDQHTGSVVGQTKTLTGARRSVDKRDNAYGAYRYKVRVVRPDQQ